MFCKAKHKGEGLLPFYRIIYRIAALRGVALVILGRCHEVTEELETVFHQSVYVGSLTPSPYGHSPYIAVRLRGRVSIPDLLLLQSMFLIPLSF